MRSPTRCTWQDILGYRPSPRLFDATDQSGCSDASARRSARNVDPSCGPFAVAVDAANNTLYVADGFANSAPGIIVSVFDGRTCEASDLTGCATQTCPAQ